MGTGETIDGDGGHGQALIEGSLQEGVKEVAARRLQAGTRGMLVRHTPEVRLQMALRRAQLRDTELLRPAVDKIIDASSDSESEEESNVFRYLGPDGPHIERVRQQLRAASFGKGETHGHGQQVKTLFERFDTENNGVILSRADFGDMLRRGGKASVNRTHDDVRRTSLRLSDDRPGHAAPLELSEHEVDMIFRALDPTNKAGGVQLDKLHAFVWGTTM